MENDTHDEKMSRRDTLKSMGWMSLGAVLAHAGFYEAYDKHQSGIDHPSAAQRFKRQDLGEKIRVTAKDSQVRPEEKEIVDNIVSVLPKSAQYIEDIVGAVHAYEKIFPVPLEIAAALFNRESKYDPKARSRCFALGIAQFMRSTAIEEPFNMTVYTEETHKVLYDLESAIMPLNADIAKLERKWGNLKAEKKYAELALSINASIGEYNKKIMQRTLLQKQYDTIFDETITPENDQRTDAHISIVDGVWYVALLADMVQERYHGDRKITILRALSIYNSGPKQSRKNPAGISTNDETRGFIEDITFNSDRIIDPRGWLNTGKEAILYAQAAAKNPQDRSISENY
jgi:hypothetical protein